MPPGFDSHGGLSVKCVPMGSRDLQYVVLFWGVVGLFEVVPFFNHCCLLSYSYPGQPL